MSCVHIKMQKSDLSDQAQILDVLKEKLCRMGSSAELTTEVRRDSQDTQITMLTFEKYFLRNGNYAGLTVLLMQSGGSQTADIVGFAGGNGLLNISWGANESFANEAKALLLQNGFSEEA